MKPDMSCVPYQRRGLYLALTIPFVLLLIAVTVYLATVNVILSVLFIALYLGMCGFQAYCCAYQECPYIEGFCPAVAGIVPSSWLARWFYGQREVIKSKRTFEVQAILAISCWLGLILLPLWWIYQRSLPWVVGYLSFHAIYYILFGLTICPACAIRKTCPGGKLQALVRGVSKERPQ